MKLRIERLDGKTVEIGVKENLSFSDLKSRLTGSAMKAQELAEKAHKKAQKLKEESKRLKSELNQCVRVRYYSAGETKSKALRYCLKKQAKQEAALIRKSRA